MKEKSLNVNQICAFLLAVIPLTKLITAPAVFADYCNEDFDSVYILHPYSNTEKTSFKNLKMSNSLRGVCNANISFDSFYFLEKKFKNMCYT